MTGMTPLHEALLELGLEDLIPLPEIVETPEVRTIIDRDGATELVSRALVDLLRQGTIQVFTGSWPDEPTVVRGGQAEQILLDQRRYSFDAEEGGLERVFFVNARNVSSE